MKCADLHEESDVPKTPETWSNNVPDLVEKTQALLERNLPNEAEALNIRERLETGDIRFYFQGIFNESKRRMKGELLARMDGPNGIISPDSFNPVIESIGQKSAFDHLVIQKAFEAIARVKPLVPCAININPSTFEQGDHFLAYIDKMQALYGIDSKMVILEILETEPIKNYDRFNNILHKLRKRWYQTAMDDYHPDGHNNLICIENITELDSIKIDGAYVYDLYDVQNTKWTVENFLKTISDMRKSHLNADIVIERIKNREMFTFFDDLDIDNVNYQGYYFHKASAF